MIEFTIGGAAGVVLTVLPQLASPKVSDVIGNVHRSRALAKAKALIATAEAQAQALAAAKAAVAAAAVKLPTPPPNPLANASPTGATGA